jgi:diguanylate cyclase (GGDEF)-like protein
VERGRAIDRSLSLDVDRAIICSILLSIGVFLLCLFGIVTRPQLDLATFWPANAFMLGMLVRFPVLARPLSWLCCAIGFGLADAIAGSKISSNIVLNGGNLAAIATGYFLFSRLDAQDKRLRRPLSVLHFFGAVLGASVTAGLVGAVANPLLFDEAPAKGFAFWFATELVNYTAFLPMLLTFPSVTRPSFAKVRRRLAQIRPLRVAPLLALVVSGVAGVVIGGPGAVAFPVPALLWCALAYDIFATSCLAFLFGAWTLLAIRAGLIPVGAAFDSRTMLISARVGVTLVALGPLVVASVMAARTEVIKRLHFLADHDAMTGLQNRRSFLETGSSVLSELARDRRSSTVMMLDIDHFKSINDTYGHAAGDRIITGFAEIMARNVRPEDKVGRVGGEEFAVLLSDCTMAEAVVIAQRINDVFRSTSFTLDNGAVVAATVSIGVHMDQGELDLERLLTYADKALYRAKEAGRNRFEISRA